MAEVTGSQKGVPRHHKRLSYMCIKGMNSFTWTKEDIFNTPEEDILFSVDKTEVVNSHGYIGLTKIDVVKVKKMMLNYHS